MATVHQVAPIHFDGIGIGGGDVPVFGDVLIELDVHEAVIFERVHLPGLGFARLQEAQRLRNRHLIDQHLTFAQRRFGNAMPGLDDAGFGRVRGGGNAGRLGEEAANGNGIGGVVGALIDDLQHIIGAKDGCGHLYAAGASAVGRGGAVGAGRGRAVDRTQGRAGRHTRASAGR